jgi:hypothetical protein
MNRSVEKESGHEIENGGLSGPQRVVGNPARSTNSVDYDLLSHPFVSSDWTSQ